MAHLDLGGASLETSPERDALVSLRARYLKAGLKHQAAFFKHFESCTTADALFQSLPDVVERAFNETTEMAAADIAAHKIYDLDLAAIKLDLSDRVDTVREGFDGVQDRYFAILGKTAELDAQRTEARENRGRIVGGGFGVEDAVGGMALATAANVAIGITYGLANLTAKAGSMLGDAKKKRALLEDPQTKRDLGDFLCRLVLQGHKLVADVINRRSQTKVFDVISGEARRRGSALIENVSSGRVPEPEVRSVLVQALEHDPFSDLAWQAWLDQYGDGDGKVERSAEALGVRAVADYKKRKLDDKRASLDWSTPEAIRESCSVLDELACSFGHNFESERKAIYDRADQLDRELRSFDGVEYETVDAMKAAQERQAEVAWFHKQRTFNGINYETVEEADQARANIAKRYNAKSDLGWATLAIRRTTETNGRSRRKELWWFELTFVILIISAIVLDSIFLPYYISILTPLVFFVSIVIRVNLYIRRLHDFCQSGVWLITIPIGIGLVMLLLCLIVDGTVGDNKYGPDPKLRQPTS